MNQSIKKIFDYIQLFLIISVFFSTSILLISLNNNKTFIKLNNLNVQKEIVYSLVNIDIKNNISLDKTALNFILQDLITNLDIKTEELFQIYEYNFIEKLSVDNSLEYTNDLKKLKELIYNLTEVSIEYYNLKPDTKDNLKQSASYIYKHINSMIFKNINYNEYENNMYKLIIWITFFIILIVAVWLRRKLMLLYKDIDYLPNNAPIKLHKEDAEIKVVDAKDTKIKVVDAKDNLFTDPITGINNYLGMMSCFKNKKNIQENNCISVTILEIDKFSKLDNKYSKEVMQSILQKVSTILSFHVKVTDIIAKTDYNQFTIILSRPNESQSINDINLIHKSISEMKISNKRLGDIILTISAGFMVKHKSISIDKVLEETNQLMLHSRKKGGNMISNVKDLIKDDLYKLARIS